MRDSIVFYDSWGRMICDLTNEQAALLVKMIFNYSFNDLVSESDDIAVNAIFKMIREKLDEDAKTWEETRRRRSEGGKKGMSSRWGLTRDNSVITQDNSVNESYAELKEVITPITVSESVSVSKNKKKDIERKAFIPPTLDEVRAYCTERNSAVNPQTFYDYYTEGKWRDSSGKPVKSWKQKLITWEKSEPKRESKSKTNKFNQFEQNSYDFEELEKRLISN